MHNIRRWDNIGIFIYYSLCIHGAEVKIKGIQSYHFQTAYVNQITILFGMCRIWTVECQALQVTFGQ